LARNLWVWLWVRVDSSFFFWEIIVKTGSIGHPRLLDDSTPSPVVDLPFFIFAYFHGMSLSISLMYVCSPDHIFCLRYCSTGLAPIDRCLKCGALASQRSFPGTASARFTQWWEGRGSDVTQGLMSTIASLLYLSSTSPRYSYFNLCLNCSIHAVTYTTAVRLISTNTCNQIY